MAHKFVSLKSIDNCPPIESNNVKSQPELTLGMAQSFPELRSHPKNLLTVLPNFPEFSKGLVRKSISVSKSPKAETTPLGLFPMKNATPELTEEIRQTMYSRIGVPRVIIPINNDKPQHTGNSPTNQNSGSKTKEKDISFKEVVASPKNVKPKEESSSIRKRTDTEMSSAPPTKKLMKKLSSGRVVINNLSETELMDLAIEILRKPKNDRSTIDISILTKYLSHVEFFKKQESKVIEGCLRAMYHISLPVGESVFNIGDQGTNFWVLLKGSVGVWLNTDQPSENHNHHNNHKKNAEIVLKEARTLHAGSAFGEVALGEKKTRTATIICKEDCDFAVLDQTPFKEIMKEVQDQKLFEEANFLAALPLFKAWPFNEIKFLFYSSPIVSYKRGAVIYEEGSHPEKMYIIKKGTFKVLKEIDIEDTEHGEEVHKIKRTTRAKKTVELGILGEKEVFGEDELFDFSKRKYKITCDSLEAEVFEINTKEFRTRILDSAESKKWLAHHMAAKKKYYEERARSIINATHKHRHLWFFNRDSPVPKPSTRLLSRANNTLLNTSESPFPEEEKPLISNYPKIKTTFRQGFLGENPKFMIPISPENTEIDSEGNIKVRTDANKSRHRKIKTMTCPTSPINSNMKELSPSPSPLEFDLLKKAIEERSYKPKKSPLKGKKKSFSKEKLQFHESIIQGLTKNVLIEDDDENDFLRTLNFEKSKTNSPSPSPSPTPMKLPAPSIASIEPLPSVKKRTSPTLKGFNSAKDSIKIGTMETMPESEAEQKSTVKYLQYPPIDPVNIPKSRLSTALGGDSRTEELFRMMAQHTDSGSVSFKIDKSRDYTLQVDGIKESSRINFEAQRNKWKGIIQEKGGKNFRKMFYSRDDSVSLEKTEILLQQQRDMILKPNVKETVKEKTFINKHGTYSPRTQFFRLQTAYEGLKKVVNPAGPNISINGEKVRK